MNETWTTGVTREPSEPVTLESMIEAVEQISKTLPKCWHYDLVTSEWLPKSASGITYACVKCFTLFTVPADFLGTDDPPKRITIDLFRGGIAHEQ